MLLVCAPPLTRSKADAEAAAREVNREEGIESRPARSFNKNSKEVHEAS